jgi:hypothetical protein
MITDSMIDGSSAKYMCAFAKFDFEKAKAEYEKARRSDSDGKKAVQMAVQLAANRKPLSGAGKPLNEGFFSSLVDFLKAPPAWVDEPTGFNDQRPETVFRDDVEGGIEGWHKGEAAAAATAAAVLGRKVIPAVAKSAARHPVATVVAGAALTHPQKAAELADNGVDAANDAIDVAKKLADHKDLFEKIADFFAPAVNFVSEHPAIASAAGAACYGLLRTWPIWWPYMRRLNYELTSGKALAACEFEANDRNWRFEYSLKKARWTLLSGGRIAPQPDAVSFSQTEFAGRFIGRCREILENAFANAQYVAAASEVASKDDANAVAELLKNRSKLEATMFAGKITT